MTRATGCGKPPKHVSNVERDLVLPTSRLAVNTNKMQWGSMAHAFLFRRLAEMKVE